MSKIVSQPSHTISVSSNPVALVDVVRAQERFTRSIHIERDLNRADDTLTYCETETGALARRAILEGISTPSGRAITLIGPYGSGKSAFCVDLARRCSAPDAPVRLLPVPVVGSRRALGVALLAELERAFSRLPDPALRRRLTRDCASVFDALTNGKPVSPRDVSDAFVVATQLANEAGFAGLLVLVDEMGKFLEYAAHRPEEGDLFIMQELAEAAARSEATSPLLLLTVLHQNLEAYARSLSRREQAEWQKVGERFQQVPFFPADQEQLDLIAQALTLDASAGEMRGRVRVGARAAVKMYCDWCAEVDVRPLLPQEMLAQRSQSAYPLHLLTLLALPTLFRRAGQSHRSLFSFLSSPEPDALARFLSDTPFPAPSGPLPYYTLDRLADYAALLLQSAPGAGRAWADALEAVEFAEGLVSANALRTLKVIALLSTLKDPRLSAATDLLALALSQTVEQTEAPLRELQGRRLIVFRRQSRSWRLSEGGDIDIETEIATLRATLPENGMALQAAQTLCPPRLQVARRHSYRTGTLRAAQTVVCSPETLAQCLTAARGHLAVLFCVAPNTDAIKEAEAAARQGHENALILIAAESDALREAARDLAATDKVERETPGMESDRAARRELYAHREESEAAFRAEWNRLFHSGDDIPTASDTHLYYNGKSLTPEALGAEGWPIFLSEMADRTYSQSPVLLNELVNRPSLSSAAAAGRRALVEGMADPERAVLPHLGIPGYPPERSMYECLLLRPGLHRQTATGEWRIVPPDPADDPANLYPAWKEWERLLFETPIPEPILLSDLFAALNAPPYGLTNGVLPVLFTAFMRVHDEELSFYREGIFRPEPSAADLELLLRRPELFAVAGCRIRGARQAVVTRIASALQTEPGVIPVVRGLLRMVRSLEEYAWKTQRLSPTVLALRRAIERASAPEAFLFVSLPDALGLPPIQDDADAPDDSYTEAFFPALNGAIRDWSAAFPTIRRACRDRLLTACGLPAGDAGWRELQRLSADLIERRGLLPPALIPLLRRAAGSGAESTVDSVLSHVSGRAARTWGDADVQRFMEQADALGSLFREAVAGLSSVTAPTLVPIESQEKDRIAATLRRTLPADTNPRILRAALLSLLQELDCTDGMD